MFLKSILGRKSFGQKTLRSDSESMLTAFKIGAKGMRQFNLLHETNIMRGKKIKKKSQR